MNTTMSLSRTQHTSGNACVCDVRAEYIMYTYVWIHIDKPQADHSPRITNGSTVTYHS